MSKEKDKPLRSIEIYGHPYLSSKTGFFHRWSEEAINDADNLYTKTMALVELGDGKVRLIEPEYLKFTEPYKP